MVKCNKRDLVDVELFNDDIKTGVKVVQEVHNLKLSVIVQTTYKIQAVVLYYYNNSNFCRN